MLKWAASLSAKVASSVTETFAPLFRSPLEQLTDAWRSVEADCQSLMERTAEEMDDPRLLLDSPLVHHLNQLVEALVREEEEQAARTQHTHGHNSADGEYGGSSSSSGVGGGSSPFDGLGGKDASKSATGPCFEYFLNEKILDRLCALGLPDRPLGMRQLITKTLDAILLNTRHPILPSMSVVLAVRNFLDVCYSREDHRRRGYRSAFLSLLHTIAKKIKDDPSLAGIFFDSFPAKEKRKPEFLLFTALCALMSESSEGAIAYESLLWIVQLPNAAVCEYVLTHSDFVAHTLTSLANLFRALPPASEAPLVDDLLSGSYPSLDMFFRRWVYVDDVCRSSYEVMQRTVVHQLHQSFLLPIVQPMLLDDREAVACWTTNFIKHLLINAQSHALRQAIVHFLLGTDLSPEQAPPTSSALLSDSSLATESSAGVASSSVGVRSVLLKRLDSLSDQLCMHTLDLLQTLIGLRDPLVVNNLVLRNLLVQQPATAAAGGGADASLDASAVAVPALAGAPTDILPIQQFVMFAGFNDLPEFAALGPPFEEYLLDAQLEGQLWMQAWDDLAQRSAQKRADDLDRDASAAVAAAVNDAAGGDSVSPLSGAASGATAASSGPSPSATAAPFFEGLFLSTLLNKLETLYENSFATNLKLTSVLSKLSYCPNPTLHYFLFNPDIAMTTTTTAGADDTSATAASDSSSVDSARLVLHVLRSVWNKGVKRASRMANFARRKEEARHRLNQSLSPSGSLTATQSSGSVETMDGERFLRGIILLEEFLKEWYAIAQSKARLFALQKLARLQGPASITSPAGAAAAAAAAARMSASRHTSMDLAAGMGMGMGGSGSTVPAAALRSAAADLVLAGEGPLMPSPSATPSSAQTNAHGAMQQDWPVQVETDADALP